jgi:hypothetical protein
MDLVAVSRVAQVKEKRRRPEAERHRSRRVGGLGKWGWMDGAKDIENPRSQARALPFTLKLRRSKIADCTCIAAMSRRVRGLFVVDARGFGRAA